MPCPLCGSSVYRNVFRLGRRRMAPATGRHTEDLFGRSGPLVRCTGCGLTRQEGAAVAPYAEAEDPEYLDEEPAIRQTFRDALRHIEGYQAPGRLLDVGCGPGLGLEEARARGWKAAGVEPSLWGVNEARRRGLDVIHGTLEDAELQSASFDAVVAADVIEHVRDPVALACRIHELLRPGGVAFITTPNVASMAARILRRWWWSVIPNHLWYFTPRTLDHLVRRSGLEPIQCTTHPKTFSIEYYAGRLGGYNTVLGRAARRLGRALGGHERLITPDFRDRIAMIAVRPS